MSPDVDTLDLIASSPLVRTVREHFLRHFMWRLAHLGPAGVPPRWLLESANHRFVLNVGNFLWKVEGAFLQSHSLIRQVENTPPTSWLDQVGSTVDNYRQQELDLFTTVLFSAVDRSLLLVNEVLDLGIPQRHCFFRAVSEAVSGLDAVLAEKLSNLREAAEPVADPRHFFVHRGDHRELFLFSAVHRAKVVTKQFDVPIDGVKFNETGALNELLEAMRSDLRVVGEAIRPVLDSLHDRYLIRFEALGGLDRPTEEDILRAAAVINYFQGGAEPEFMR